MESWVKKRLRAIHLVLLYVSRIIFAKNHHKVSFRQKLSANLRGGFLADQYALYDFAHHDRWDYLSEFDWYKSRYINSPHNFMLNNKVICAEMLRPYVDMPKILIVKTRGRYIGPDGCQLDEVSLISLFPIGQAVYFKPMSAGKGKDVLRIEADGESFNVNGKTISPGALGKMLSSRDNWYISEHAKQGSYSASLYDKTTNTVRFIVLKDAETASFKAFFAVQRIGVKSSIPVDNGSRGGLVAKIDMASGELSHAQTLHSLDVHDVHPDTGAPIKGVVVPGWDKVKAEVLAMSDHFWWLNLIAWDLVLTDIGISVIEANTSSGVNIIQLWGGQRNLELGDFYRQHGVIKPSKAVKS